MTERAKAEAIKREQAEHEEVKRDRGLWAALSETYNEFFEKDAMSQAAAVAFYAGLSLAPILTLTAWVAQNVFGEGSKQNIVAAFQQVLGRQAAAPIKDLLTPASEQAANGMTLAGIISMVILLFSATGVFGQLQAALNRMWEVQHAPSAGMWSYVRKRILSFGMLLTMMFLLMVSMAASAAIQALVGLRGDDQTWLLSLLHTAVSVGLFTVLFALMFRYIPDAQIAWRDVWVGGLISAMLFVAGKFVLGMYLGRGSYENSYGTAVGSFVALLVWVYYSSIIVFIGAEATQVYARRHGHHARPEDHAVRVEHKVVPKMA